MKLEPFTLPGGVLGITAFPREFRAGCGVVFVNGWSGNCAGPHRIFSVWSERLCQGGTASVRFDFRGRGDSLGSEDATTVYTMTEDLVEAVQYFRDRHRPRRLSLVSLCSGSLVVLGALSKIRVDSLVLISPAAEFVPDGGQVRRELRAAGSHAWSYTRKAIRPETWRRLWQGRIDLRSIVFEVLRLRRLGLVLKNSSGPIRSSHPVLVSGEPSAYWTNLLSHHLGPTFVCLGSRDPNAKEAAASFSGLPGRVDVRVFENCDTTFASVDAQETLILEASRWLKRERLEAGAGR